MFPDGFLALPIHPAFVHFPVAALSMTWILVLLGHATGSERWQRLATNIEWIGVLFVPLVVVTGIRDAEGFDFLLQPDWSQPLIWHFLVSLAAAGTFTIHAIWRHRSRATAKWHTILDIGLVTAGFWLLVMTGLLAGEMVFG